MAHISADRIEAPATNETSPCDAPQSRVVGTSIARRLGRLKAVLDERHAGHEEVKQAILEHFNIGLRREAAGLPGVGPVLCLEGPPGRVRPRWPEQSLPGWSVHSSQCHSQV